MTTRRALKIISTVGLALLLAIYGLLVERVEKVETIQLTDGSSLSIKSVFYDWKSFGSPHALLIGGGNILTILSSDDPRFPQSWYSFQDEVGILAADDGNSFWLVTLDRTVFRRSVIRGYVAQKNGPWRTADLATLPINKAVQNMWLNDDDKKLLSDFDPSSSWAQGSLTARLWWLMKNGKQIEDSPESFIQKILDSDFAGCRSLPK